MLQLYKIITAALACTGCAGLVIPGETSLLMSVTGAGLLPGYYRFLKGMPPAPQWVIGGCSVLALLVFFLDSIFISSDYFIGVAHLTITFQAIKSFDLKEPWDHLQVYFVALLQLIIASEIMYSVTFGFLFVLFLVFFVTAIVFAHFMKEGAILRVDLKKPILYISLLTLIITVVFFISIPRISGGIWSKGHVKSIKSVGFSEKVHLGSFGAFKLDPTVIMRVELDPLVPGPYYWRGMTLDYFDGTSWISTLMKTRRVIKKSEEEFVVQPSSEDTVTQQIMLEPIDSDIIFGLNRVGSIKGTFRRLEKDPATSLFVWKKRSKRIQYTARSNVDETIPVKSIEIRYWERYMHIPDSLRGKIKTLTETILKEEGAEHLPDLQKAKAIERYLRDNYRYSLYVKAPDDNTNPIIYFLFQSKTGFCEHYATAMTLMLRSAGIPARVVTGFLGGELNTYGDYIIVRQSNAHSWVEAVIGGSWRRFDPTPSVLVQPPSTFALHLDMLGLIWNRYVIAFSLADQKEIVAAVSMPFIIPQLFDFRFPWLLKMSIGVLLILMIVVTFYLLKHIQFKRYGFVSGQYTKLQKILKRKGIVIKQSSTSSEVRNEALQLGAYQRIQEFIKLYEEYRFGSREMGREGRARYQNLMREIKRQLRK
jgi:transglutaminase-like putative cysteine protease